MKEQAKWKKPKSMIEMEYIIVMIERPSGERIVRDVMKIGRRVWLDNDTILKPKDGKIIGWINWPEEDPPNA